MAAGWERSWRRVHSARFVGGQGESFLARSISDPDLTVFVKTLRHQSNRQARKRFVREATAYETLEPFGIPRLIEHNADDWRESRTLLYLILEYVPGPTLAAIMRDSGPLALDDALDCVLLLAEILGRCHADGVLHRDVKPANIVCRDADPARPCIVDFGLSFHAAELSNVTRVDEEIGNRFLRLPEHTLGVRNAASDLTQLAGVLLFLLTGTEPRVLLDEQGVAPHQRTAAAEKLQRVLTGRPLRRLLAIFDRAFAVSINHRFGSAAEFRAALREIREPEDESTSLNMLLDRLDRSLATPTNAGSMADRRRLDEILSITRGVAKEMSRTRSMLLVQSGQSICVDGATRFGRIRLGLALSSNGPTGPEYRFEIRGPELVLLVNGVESWRSRGPDDTLPAIVQRSLLSDFLERHGD